MHEKILDVRDIARHHKRGPTNMVYHKHDPSPVGHTHSNEPLFNDL